MHNGLENRKKKEKIIYYINKNVVWRVQVHILSPRKHSLGDFFQQCSGKSFKNGKNWHEKASETEIEIASPCPEILSLDYQTSWDFSLAVQDSSSVLWKSWFFLKM